MKAAAGKRGAERARSHRYHVYVVELSARVWNVAAFRRANPDYMLGKPFVFGALVSPDMTKKGLNKEHFESLAGLTPAAGGGKAGSTLPQSGKAPAVKH